MSSHRWRVYINPFDYSGNYTSYQEITADVDFSSFGAITQNLDNTDYDIGVYRFANFNITLRNDSGKYLDVDSTQSIFKYKRGNSLCKVTWEQEMDGPYAAIATAGEDYLSLETELFVGLLNDDSATMDLDTQNISFAVIGRESILDQVIVPFGLLSVGQLNSSVIYAMLNQAAVTNILTVSAGNITLGVDVALDSIADLQNKTVKAALDDLLLISNSVLYISNGAIIIAPRTPTAAVKYTFYGQASNSGPENIQNITNIKTGRNRIFNYLYWKTSNTTVLDATSTAKYGVISKEFDQTYVTSGTSQLSILTAILNEFSGKKQEFDLHTPFTFNTLAINLLDRVLVDYPAVIYSASAALPVLGSAVLGTAVLPSLLWAFKVDTTVNYKVIGKEVSPDSDLCMLKLRAI